MDPMQPVDSSPKRRRQSIYQDPLELIWLHCAEQAGYRVKREDSAFAAFDGRGTIIIANSEELDADDSLAQLVLHELCHACIAGPRNRRCIDWGLEPEGDQDRLQELATLCLQADLCESFGLRRFFAPTTEHRADYLAIPPGPVSTTADKAARLAARSLAEPANATLLDALRRALYQTARVAAIVAADAPENSLWRTVEKKGS